MTNPEDLLRREPIITTEPITVGRHPDLPTLAIDAAEFSNTAQVREAALAAERAGKLTPIGENIAHFSGTPGKRGGMGGLLDWIANGFSTPKSAVATDGIAKAVSQIGVEKEALAFAEEHKLSDLVTSTKQKIEALQKTLVGHAEKLVPQMKEAKEAHANAAKAFLQGQSNALEKLNTSYLEAIAQPSVTEETKATLMAAREAEATRLAEHFKPLVKKHEDIVKGIANWEQQIESHAGVKVDEILAKAGKAGSVTAHAASGVVNISEEAKTAGVIGKEAYEAESMGKWGRLKQDVKANWNVSSIEEGTGIAKNAGAISKIARVAGTGVGAIIGGYGLKDLGQVVGFVPPDTDEQGKEVQTDVAGKLFKSAAELGIAAGIIYGSLVAGGKGKAISNIAHFAK